MTFAYREIALKIILVGIAICVSLLEPELTGFVTIVATICILILTINEIYEENLVLNIKGFISNTKGFIFSSRQVQMLIPKDKNEQLNLQLVAAQACGYKTKEFFYLQSLLLKLEKNISDYRDIKRIQIRFIENKLPEMTDWLILLIRGSLKTQIVLSSINPFIVQQEITRYKLVAKSSKKVTEIANARRLVEQKSSTLRYYNLNHIAHKNINQRIYEYKNLLEQCYAFSRLLKKIKASSLLEQEYSLIENTFSKINTKIILIQ